MNAASIAQAKDQLTRLVHQAEQGEVVQITLRTKKAPTKKASQSNQRSRHG